MNWKKAAAVLLLLGLLPGLAGCGGAPASSGGAAASGAASASSGAADAGIAQQMIFHYMRACPDRAAAKAGEC